MVLAQERMENPESRPLDPIERRRIGRMDLRGAPVTMTGLQSGHRIFDRREIAFQNRLGGEPP